MKLYLLKPSEKKKLGDKTEQYYLAEYSETETLALKMELSIFLKGQIKNSGDPSRPGSIDAGSVKEKLNLVAATCREDILGLFQRVGSEAIR